MIGVSSSTERIPDCFQRRVTPSPGIPGREHFWFCLSSSAYCNFVAVACALLTPSSGWDELWPETLRDLLCEDLKLPVFDIFSLKHLFSPSHCDCRRVKSLSDMLSNNPLATEFLVSYVNEAGVLLQHLASAVWLRLTNKHKGNFQHGASMKGCSLPYPPLWNFVHFWSTFHRKTDNSRFYILKKYFLFAIIFIFQLSLNEQNQTF